MEKTKNMLTVIVPCFNEEEGLLSFHRDLCKTLDALEDIETEIILVNDGSTDNTISIMKRLVTQDNRVRILSLSRNFGHQIALTAGIDHAQGDILLMMDADLQHPPELIPSMIQKWQEGNDIVSAVRQNTKDASWFKKLTSNGFYYCFNKMSEISLPVGVADFCLLSRQVYQQLQKMEERHRFLRGMISWLGFKRAFIPYTAPERVAGQTKYTMSKMIALAVDATLSFSTKPLRLATRVGLLITLAGFLYLIWIVSQYFFNENVVSGWASVIGVLLVLGGFQLVFIGLIGQYLARVFEESKDRPLYVLDESIPGKRGGVKK